MNDLNEYLKHYNLYLTLLTNDGDRYDAGIVDYVKPYTSKAILRWENKVDFLSDKPFTLAVLHNNKTIFDGFYIKPFIPSTESVIELVYS